MQRFVRVAVVQLGFHPAFTNADGRRLLQEPEGLEEATWLPLGDVPVECVEPMKELRRRIEDAYTRQLEKRTTAILDWCRERQVQVVVFPEYSLPVTVVERIAARGDDMVIVAGTHLVDNAALRSGVYERLGGAVPSRDTAVSPVLHRGRLLALVPKLDASPVDGEQDVLTRGNGWTPVELGEAFPGPMGVAICIDFLNQKPPISEASVRLWAVPSLSRTTEDFEREAQKRTKRTNKCPVLYSNSSEAGMSAVFVDERHPSSEFPLALGAGEEGVVVADVDLGERPPGKSTGYADQPVVKPVAAPSFVYTARRSNHAYAEWLTELSTVLSQATEDEAGALGAVSGLASCLKEVIAGSLPGTRERRLSHFMNTAESLSLAGAKKWTDEIVLPPDVLPLPAVQAVLARGAAAVLRWLRDTQCTEHPFAEREFRLLKQAGRARAGEWNEAGLRAAQAIESAVRAEAPPINASAEIGRLSAIVGFYEQEGDRGFAEKQAESLSALKAEQFDDAARRLTSMLEDAEALASAHPDAREARTRVSQVRLQRAAALINLQRPDEAAQDLERVDTEALDPRGWTNLANMLVVAGESRRARDVIARAETADLDDPARHALAVARQRLELRGGVLPEPLVDDGDVLLDAAGVELGRGRLRAAVTLARGAVALEPERQLLRAHALLVLVDALRDTVFEWPRRPELLPVEMRAGVIDDIELWLERLDQWAQDERSSRLPPRTAELVRSARRAYCHAVNDWDAVDALGPAQSSEGHEERSLREARECARTGDLQSALSLLPATDYAWLSDLWRAGLVELGGDSEQALEQQRALVHKYPGLGPVEASLAESELRAGNTDRAVEHARKATEVVPARGYRLILARCLAQAGLLSDAWDTLRQDGDRGGPSVILTLARLADAIHPHEAPGLWTRYVKLRPEDGRAKVTLARSLRCSGHEDDAANTAWDAFDLHGHELDANSLFWCAWLQRRDAPLGLGAGDRMVSISRILHERFPSDPAAERLRLELESATGEDSRVPPVNWQLLADAGLVQSFPAAQVIAAQSQCWDLYRVGAMSLTGLASALGQSVSGLVVDLLSRMERRFCAPVPASTAPSSLAGFELVLGEGELVLLSCLDVIEPLRQAARRNGATVLVDLGTRRALEAAATAPDGVPGAGRALDLIVTGEGEGWVHVRSWHELQKGLSDSVPQAPPARDPGSPEDIASKALQQALEAAGAVLARPNRWQVSLDFFSTAWVPHTAVVQALAWSDREQYRATFEGLRRASARTLSIPELVRLILPRDDLTSVRRQHVLHMLAQHGFPDALSADELVEEFRRTPNPSLLQRALEGIEHQARVTQWSPIGDAGRLHLATLYAQAVVRAFLPAEGPDSEPSSRGVLLPGTSAEPARPLASAGPLPLNQARVLSATLLERAEQVDGGSGTLLDMVLAYVALDATARPGSTVEPKPHDAKTLVLAESSPAGLMWSHLGAWAGPNGSRRSSLGRALREAWSFLDQVEPATGPAAVRQLQLVLAGRVANTPTDHADRRQRLPRLEEPDEEASAILSWSWEERPLRYAGVEIRHESAVEERPDVLLWEDALMRGAKVLSTAASSDAGVAFNDRWVEVDMPLGETKAPFRVLVPIEAALLRVPGDAARGAILQLKRRQGRHDGRAYALLDRLEQAPADTEARRAYARYSATALWRLVRDDPAYLVRWPRRRSGSRDDRLPTLESLCEVLHEPLEPIDRTMAPHEVLEARLQEAWSTLDGHVRLGVFFQVAQIPGALAARAANYGLASTHLAKTVEASLSRLEQPDVHPAALLALDVMQLRLAVAKQPVVGLRRGTVDLRQILPTTFEKLLEAACRREGEKTSMARYEPALLRACASVCNELLTWAPGRTEHDRLWLTYRLHAWLCDQLASLDTEDRQAGIEALAQAAPLSTQVSDPASVSHFDLFEPLLFDARGFDYRLAVVLFSLRAMEDLVRTTTNEAREESTVATISSPGLEARLLDVASSVLPRRAHVRTWLDWGAPDNAPDLALSALLGLNDERVLAMDPAALVGRLEGWPSGLDGLTPPEQRLIEQLVRVLSHYADRLAPPVRDALESSLQRLGSSALDTKLKWLGLTCLFGTGAQHLEALVRPLVEAHVQEPDAGEVLARFFEGVAARGLELLGQEVVLLIEHWHDVPARIREVIPVALGRLVIHGASPLRHQATALLVDLPKHPVFRNDERLAELVALLGPKESEQTA